MLEVEIPGRAPLRLTRLVLDYNGTLARDGVLLPGVAGRLEALAAHLEVHVLTADTFGSARAQLAALPCPLAVTVLPAGNQAQAKADHVARLGAGTCACIGNGRNDRLMLREAVLGIAVVDAEGAAVEAVLAAAVVTRSAVEALDLLLEPRRLAATLRA